MIGYWNHIEYEDERDRQTDQWLRENDPYYRDTKKNKRKQMEYSYETVKQKEYRRSKELPFSSLFKNRIYELANKGVDIKNLLTDD